MQNDIPRQETDTDPKTQMKLYFLTIEYSQMKRWSLGWILLIINAILVEWSIIMEGHTFSGQHSAISPARRMKLM